MTSWIPDGIFGAFVFGVGFGLGFWLVDGIKALVGRMAKGA